MQYLLIFAAVFLVAGVMIIFMFTAIRQIAIRIREQVSSRYLRELSGFDRIYEEKMQRLQSLQEEEERFNSNLVRKSGERKNASGMGASIVTSSGEITVSRVADAKFSGNYRYVKNALCQDIAKLLERTARVPGKPENQLADAAEMVLEILTPDRVFEISTLEESDQKNLLLSAFTGEVKDFLLYYMLNQSVYSAPGFSVLKFWEYADTVKRLYSRRMALYTADPAFQTDRSDTDVFYDESICEGVRIVRGNTLYDYSI